PLRISPRRIELLAPSGSLPVVAKRGPSPRFGSIGMVGKWITGSAVLIVAVSIGVTVALAARGEKLNTRNVASKTSPGDEQLWWDPMLGPSSITDHPGKSAMGMDLVPYTRSAGGGPEVQIDPRVVQDMGVQTAPVPRGPLHKTIRAIGI